MSYSESIQKIKAARVLRDTAQQQLYAARMKFITLNKLQQKADKRDILQSRDTAEAIEKLRTQIKELQALISDLKKQRQQVEALEQRINELNALAAQLEQEAATIQNEIEGINNELENAELDEKARTALKNKKEVLVQQFTEINKRLETLQAEISQAQRSLAGLDDKEKITAAIQAAESKAGALQQQLDALIRRSTQYAEDKSKELKATKAEIERSASGLKEVSASVKIAIEELFKGLSPQELIGQWNDRIPILLQPVRMETKFSAGAQKELWVRIFPDDIAVVTHENELTSLEITYGNAHWKALWHAGDDNDQKTTAWELLTKKFGLNRAAWVAKQTRPLNWEDRAVLAEEEGLVFPEFDFTKDSTWTKAPHTRVMPDCFVVLCFRAGALVHSQTGKLIDDIITLGPDPAAADDNPSIDRDAQNRIIVDEDFDWMVDFNKAVAKGLGMRIALDAQTAASGFDQLIAIGLKLSADDQDGQGLLQDLLENHRYATSGLQFVAQGTPTNNTEEEDAGYSKQQSLDDIRAFIEEDQVLFTPTGEMREATDGQRMADFLGVDYGLFQTTLNSQLRDHTEAVAMNHALYAGTLGYYMQAMLNDVLDDEGLASLRNHFTYMVTGRGPLASLRVGNQPYGLVLTSAFNKWKYSRQSYYSALNIPLSFYQNLHHILSTFETAWQQQTPSLSHISKTGNTSQKLMDILGLHPNSTDFYQRVAYSWDSLKNLEAFGWDGKYFSDIWTMYMEGMYARNLLGVLGYESQHSDGSFKPSPMLLQLIFRHYSSRLGNSNLIDGQPFSEENKIRPYEEASGKNYIDWLIENADNSAALEKQDFGEGVAKPHSLLYLLLRYSQLHEASQAIYKYLLQHNISAKEIVQTRKFVNISSTASISHWEVFEAPVHKIIPNQNSTLPLLKHVYSLPQSSNLSENLAEHSWALGILKDLPTARLERALVEHIDTLIYRLDAWQTSLFEQRLIAQRGIGTREGQRSKGIYLGAYGYLENIRPGNQRTKIGEDLLPEALREQKDNLFKDQRNGGYIHAPSLNHATAAAILRNGYLTHATPAEREMLAVNLSSERVRRAKYLLEGIQNGQTLEALLGYQFERGLHDRTTQKPNPVILNHIIPNFREAFPLKKTKIPQKGNTTGPEEITNDYHVVNGLTLANTTAAFPYGLTTLPALTNPQIDAIKREKEGIENSLDALRDVLTAEAAYQLALGNFERAAGVTQAISGTAVCPQPEVIDSARGTDLSFTNKVILNFNSTANGNPWPDVPLTQRAQTELPLNNWLATLLGAPENIRCRVMALDSDGHIITRPDASEINDIFSLKQLQIQAIDFVCLIQKTFEQSGTSELETRIRYGFAQQENLTDDTVVKIVFADAGTTDLNIKSFAEILPLADHLRQLIGNATAVKAKEYEPASKILVKPADNPDNVDWAELASRTQSLYTYFEQEVSQLNAAVSDAENLQTASAIGLLRNKLKYIADAGFVFAFPQSAFGHEAAQLELLLTQGKSVTERFGPLFEAYQNNLLTINKPETKIDTKVSLLVKSIQSVLGADYKVMPRYYFNNSAEVIEAYNSKDQLLQYSRTVTGTPLPVAEWLHGVSLVRPAIQTLEAVRLLQEGFNETDLTIAPIQLPYRDQDSWLAVAFPEGTTILDDTLSIIQINPQGFEASGLQCGLLIDAWTETIPNKEEITGISFNYNQPNCVPPQALLLTISPEETGNWKWENLVDSIKDSFARAKRRAIEPEHIDKMMGISTLLPATLTEFNTSKSGISLDYELISDFVFAEVNKLLDLKTTI